MSNKLEFNDIGLNNTPNIQSFEYNQTIKQINTGLFSGNDKIETIIIPNTQSIANGAFSRCVNLTRLVLPGINYNNKNIFGDNARLELTSLTDLSVLDGASNINTVFKNLPELTSFSFPKSITTIKDDAFDGSKDKIQRIVMPYKSGSTLITLLKSLNALEIAELNLLDDLALNKDLFENSNASTLSFNSINNKKIISIADGSFTNNKRLKSIKFNGDVFSSNITSIPNSCFAGCQSMRTINFPDSIIEFKEKCFSECNSLKIECQNLKIMHNTNGQLIFSSFPERIHTLYSNALANIMIDDKLIGSANGYHNFTQLYENSFSDMVDNGVSAYIQYTNESDGNSLPEKCCENSKFDYCAVRTNEIKANTFKNSTIKHIKINDPTASQITIHESAFEGCSRLKTVENIVLVHEVGRNAFKNTTLDLDSNSLINITKYGDYAFDGAIQLPQKILKLNIEALSHLDNFGLAPFNNCAVKQLNANEMTIAEFDAVFSSRAGQSLIPTSKDPEDIKKVYLPIKKLLNGDNNIDIELKLKDIVINKYGVGQTFDCLILNDDGTELIEFDSNASDADVWLATSMIPTGVIKIADGVFRNVLKLKKIDLNDVQEIGINAFNGCEKLEYVTGTNVLKIGNYAFQECRSLVQCVFSSKISNLGILSFSLTNNNLRLYFSDASKDAIKIILGNNEAGLSIGSKIYTSFGNNPSFITINTATLLFYEVKSPLLNVDLDASGTQLYVKTITDDTWSLIPETSISKDCFDGIGYIAANACKDLRTVNYIDLSLAYSSEKPLVLREGSLTNHGRHVLKYVFNIAYNGVNLIYYKQLIGYYDAGYKNNKIQIHFTNGYLEYDGNYLDFNPSASNELFYTDGYKKIIGVNPYKVESKINITGDYDVLGSYSLSTTAKITDLTIITSLTAIEDYAFYNNYSISNVVLGNAMLQKIGQYAFSNSVIKNINIPCIPANAVVASCFGLNTSYNLDSLSFQEGYTSIASSALIDCQAGCRKISFPTTLTSIGNYAFARIHQTDVPYITNFSLKNTKIKEFGDYAFYTALLSSPNNKLELPRTTTRIGTCAFGYNRDAWQQTIDDLSIGYFENAEANLANVNYIGPSAFIRHSFTNIKFNKNHISVIEDYAFAYPNARCKMFIPSTITKLGYNVFKGNKILNPDAIDKNQISIDVKYEQLSTIIGLTKINADFTAENRTGATDGTVLLATKSSINNYVFIYNNKMNFIPDGLSIDLLHKAIVSCDNDIVSAYIPEYIDIINEKAFANCTKLTSVYSDNDYVKFGPSAFYNCSRLINITTKNNPYNLYLDKVEPYTFYNCLNLENIQLSSKSSIIGSNAFYNCRNIINYQQYYNTQQFKYYTLSSLDDEAFKNNTRLTVFYIPQTLLSIGNSVFDGCDKLQAIYINITTSKFAEIVNEPSKTINQIIHDKFNNITLTSRCKILFNDSVYWNNGQIVIDDQYINTRLMNDSLSAISSINYNEMEENRQTYLNLSNITQVDSFVFRDVPFLQNIIFHDGPNGNIKYIGDYAFSNCESLLAINNNVLSCTELGMYAFGNCSLIDSMQLDLDSINSIGYGAFSNTIVESLIFMTNSTNVETSINKIKTIIKYDDEFDRNPLELPIFCQIIIKHKKTNSIIGRYDYLLHDLMFNDVDIVKNKMIFTDKRRDGIRPLLLLNSKNVGSLPALINNGFHVNIIGRWK